MTGYISALEVSVDIALLGKAKVIILVANVVIPKAQGLMGG